MAVTWGTLRTQIQQLGTLAARDVDFLIGDMSRIDAAGIVLHDVLPALIEQYGAAAAALTADWYDDYRESLAIAGGFRADPVHVDDRGAHALVGWAQSGAKDISTFRTLVLGGVQKRLADVARETSMRASISDPRARGWMRAGVGECEFCRMLIGRGAVYSESSVTFGSHDHCNCTAGPVFGSDTDFFDVDEYRKSLRRDRNSDPQRENENRLAREWIAANL